MTKNQQGNWMKQDLRTDRKERVITKQLPPVDGFNVLFHRWIVVLVDEFFRLDFNSCRFHLHVVD